MNFFKMSVDLLNHLFKPSLFKMVVSSKGFCDAI